MPEAQSLERDRVRWARALPMRVADMTEAEADARASPLQRSLAALGNAVEDRKRSDQERMEQRAQWVAEARRGRLPRGGEVDEGWWNILLTLAEEDGNAGELDSLARMTAHVARAGGGVLLSPRDLIGARVSFRLMLALHAHRRVWVRPVEDWALPAKAGLPEAMSSLIRHLLARYPVPAFLEAAWIGPHATLARHRGLYVHLGRGGSMKTAPLPWRLTRRAAHLFLQAPATLTVDQAMVWAEMRAQGCSEALAAHLQGTHLAGYLKRPGQRDVWRGVTAFLARHPDFAMLHAQEVLDYVVHRRFAGDVRQPGGHADFSLSGRTPVSLMADIERWHVELGRVRLPRRGRQPTGPAPNLPTEPFPVAPFGDVEMGAGTSLGFDDVAQVRFVVLGTAEALQDEGRRLGHCVLSYARRCAEGACVIVSMRVMEASTGAEASLLTIEVAKGRKVVQVKGHRNRAPTGAEMALVRAWAERAGVGIA